MYDQKFKYILEFLTENSDRIPNKSDISTQDGQQQLYQKYQNSLLTEMKLSRPNTIPDTAVSVILQSNLKLSNEEVKYIKETHQYSMAAENLVGFLLEKYIASILENHNWIWCPGSIVKSIDFIKLNADNSWEAVQVKNRDNTENSSSSQIRNGTNIKKWFRTFSRPSAKRKNNTNWEKFPEEEFRNLLSEEGFLSFIRAQMNH